MKTASQTTSAGENTLGNSPTASPNGRRPAKNSTATKSITFRALSGLLWMLSGSGVQAVLQTVVLVMLARLLRPEDFGLVGAALVVVGFSRLFSRLGMGPAIVQRPRIEERHIRTAFTTSIVFGSLLGAGVVASAPLIADFFKMQDLTPILGAIGWLFPLQGLTVVATALLNRELRFRRLTMIDVSSYGLGYGLVGVVLAMLGYGVWALVWGHLARGALKAVLLLASQPHSKRLSVDPRAFRELMYFGTGFTLARVLNYTALQGDNMVVGRWLGAEALGLYGRAYQLLVFPVSLFGSVLDQVLFASMAKIQDDQRRLATTYRRGISVIALVFAPLSALLLGLAPELILVLLGPQWGEVVLPFRILAVGMLFRASYKMSDSLSRATGAVYRRAWRQGVYALCVLGGAWIGQHWGVAGVALGVVLALTVNFLLMAQLSISVTGMTWKRFCAAHAAPGLLTGCCLLEVWGIAVLLRNWSLPPISVLLITVVITLLTLLLLVYSNPRLLLGEEGHWILRTLSEYLAVKWSRLRAPKQAESRPVTDSGGVDSARPPIGMRGDLTQVRLGDSR